MKTFTRREIAKMAAVALPALGALSLGRSLSAAEPAAAPARPKPNSKVGGVHIGLNVPYSFGNAVTTGEAVLASCLELGISAVELRSQPVEAFMGAPAPAAGGRGGAVQIPGATGAQQSAVAALAASTAELTAAVTAARSALTAASLKSPSAPAEIVEKAAALSAAEEKLAQARADWLARLQASPDRLNPAQVTAVLQANGGPAPAGGRGGGGRGGANSEELQRWRLTAPLDKAREFRRMYEEAGVFIEVVKFDGIQGFSDEVLDYAFELTRALGARAVSCEMPEGQTKRLGSFADRHRLMIGYHNHAELTEHAWETAFAEAKYNGANVDIGHFLAGQNKSPAEFIRKYHERITHIHVKDRKLNGGPNLPFGQGDTPIVEILRMIRDNRWLIQATIEFEYPVPAGSTRMAEIAKCVDFCRKALA